MNNLYQRNNLEAKEISVRLSESSVIAKQAELEMRYEHEGHTACVSENTAINNLESTTRGFDNVLPAPN